MTAPWNLNQYFAKVHQISNIIVTGDPYDNRDLIGATGDVAKWISVLPHKVRYAFVLICSTDGGRAATIAVERLATVDVGPGSGAGITSVDNIIVPQASSAGQIIYVELGPTSADLTQGQALTFRPITNPDTRRFLCGVIAEPTWEQAGNLAPSRFRETGN